MIKKLLVVLVLSLFVACGTNKPVVRTTKPTTDKPVVRNVKKPISKPIETKKTETSTASNNSKNESKTEVLEATSGAEGLEKIKSGRPHLIILDLGLPRPKFTFRVLSFFFFLSSLFGSLGGVIFNKL